MATHLLIHLITLPSIYPNAFPLLPTQSPTYTFTLHPPSLFYLPPSYMFNIALATRPSITLPYAHVNTPPCSQCYLHTLSLSTFLPICSSTPSHMYPRPLTVYPSTHPPFTAHPSIPLSIHTSCSYPLIHSATYPPSLLTTSLFVPTSFYPH